MESFTLLKYWKTTTTTTLTSTSTTSSTDSGTPPPSTTTSAAIVTDASDHDSDTAPGGVDDGPFFDLEFAIPADDDDTDENVDNEEADDNDNEHEEVDDVEVEPNMTFSPSHDLFFKGRILQINGSSDNDDVIHATGGPTKSSSSAIPVSLARSATKFRVFLLGLKRSKSESNPKQQPPPEQQPQHNHNKKFFTVKFKVEEVPIFSLLTRASSNSKLNSTTTTTAAAAAAAAATTTTEKDEGEEKSEKVESGEEKRNKKEVVMQKYLKMVKPLYVKVSKRNQKETAGGDKEMKEKDKEKMVGQKQQQQQGLNLKVIAKKHLGKSKSAVVHSMVQQQQINNNNSNGNTNTTSSKKRDDSLFQQQDGIQSAILHCKRSFNSSKDFLEGQEASSVLLTQLIQESLNEKKSATIQEECNGVNEFENCRGKGNIVN